MNCEPRATPPPCFVLDEFLSSSECRRDILHAKVSLCQSVKAGKHVVKSLFDVLNDTRKGKYAVEAGKIRRLYDIDREAYKRRKKKLPAVSFSGIFFDTRFKHDVNAYTHFMIIDVDHLDGSVEEVKNILKTDPYVACVWKSVSGKGLKALSVMDYDKPFRMSDAWVVHEYCAFPQIERYFRGRYSIGLDKTGCDITRQCFVSDDPEIYLKNAFDPFEVKIDLSAEEIDEIKRRYYSRQKVKKVIRRSMIAGRSLRY